MEFHDFQDKDFDLLVKKYLLNGLIDENPGLKDFQEELDSLLSRAGNAENRMAVLEFLCQSKISELGRHLQELVTIMEMLRKNMSMTSHKREKNMEK